MLGFSQCENYRLVFLMEAIAAIRYVNSATFAGVSSERINENKTIASVASLM